MDWVGPAGSYQGPALSPDGTRLAFSRFDQQANGDIWLLDMVRQTMSRFTFGTGADAYPIWSADGSQVLYQSDQNGTLGLYARNAAGTGTEQRVLPAPDSGVLVPAQWFGDGSVLYFASPGLDIFTVPSGGGKPAPVLNGPFLETEPRISPDGRWMAYASDETGRYEVYVQSFPPSGAKWQISSGGGRQPAWRSDGRELYYVSETPTMYAAAVRTGSTFEFDMPRMLFDFRGEVVAVRNTYIPSGDGQRFLINATLDSATPVINVVVNWPAEIRRP
jgi:Tol biopolymer transport system component